MKYTCNSDQSINKITTENIYIASEGVVVLIFKDLKSGINDSNYLHCIEFLAQLKLLSGCRLFGVDNYNIVDTEVVESVVVGWRNYDLYLLQNCL